jgi:hypothetical protein
MAGIVIMAGIIITGIVITGIVTGIIAITGITAITGDEPGFGGDASAETAESRH